MEYMMIRVNAARLVHRLPPKNLLLLNLHSNSNHSSVQFRTNRTLITCTRQKHKTMRTHGNTGSIPSKYADSLPFHPKRRSALLVSHKSPADHRLQMSCCWKRIRWNGKSVFQVARISFFRLPTSQTIIP